MFLLWERVALVVALTAVGIQFATMKAVVQRLKEISPSTWSSLGEPEWRLLTFGRPHRPVGPLRNFVLFKSDYKKLGDRVLMQMIWVARGLTVLTLTSSVAMIWLVFAEARAGYPSA